MAEGERSDPERPRVALRVGELLRAAAVPDQIEARNANDPAQLYPFEEYLLLLSLTFLILTIGYFVPGAFPYVASTLGLLGIAFFSALYPMFERVEPGRRAAVWITWLTGMLVFLLFHQNLSDFSLWVGDASSYLWDGIQRIEDGRPVGFFPPFASSLSALGYFLFGIENVPLASVILHLGEIVVVFGLLRQMGVPYLPALLSSLILAIHPLSIWFTKTTFSEPPWQLLLLATLATLINLTQRPRLSSLIALTSLLVVAPWVRGSAPFLFVVVLVVALCSDDRSFLRMFPRACTLALLLPLASLVIALMVREPYLIGWQYRRVIEAANPILVSGLLVGSCIALIAAIEGLMRLLPPRALRALALAVGLFAKLTCAAFFAAKYDHRYFDFLVPREYQFFNESFSYVAIGLFGYGAFVSAHRAITVGGPWFAILIAYFAFSPTYYLQDVTVDTPHEMAFYWSRYYFSEIFVVHFLLIVTGVAGLFQIAARPLASVRSWRSAQRELPYATIAFGLVLLACVSWTNAAYVIRTGYLSGSAQLIEWILEFRGSGTVLAFFGDAVRYGPYNGPTLFSPISRLTNGAIRVETYREESANRTIQAATKTDEATVICVAAEKCSERRQGTLIGQRSVSVKWDRYLPPYVRLDTHRIDFEADARRIPLSWDRDSRVVIGFKTARFITESGLLRDGWYQIEPGGVWSSAEADLAVPIPPGCQSQPTCRLSLEFSVFGASARSPRRVQILAPSSTLLDRSFLNPNVVVEAFDLSSDPTVRPKEMVFRIRAPDATSPKSQGMNNDTRVLGVHLSELSVE